MPGSPSLSLPVSWRTHLLTDQRPLVILVGIFALLAPLAHLADAACLEGMPEFWAGSSLWFKELIGLIRPFGHGEVILLLALACGAAGRRQAALEGLAALVLVAAVVWALKIPVGRIRPTGDPYSFPSGDAATCAILIPLVWNHFRNRAGWLLPGALILTLAVAAARVIKEYHYPSDVAAGTALGILSGIGAHLAVRRYQAPIPARWFRHGFVIALIGCCIGFALKILNGDLTPLFPPFLVAAGPVLILLIAVPWVRTQRLGSGSERWLVTIVALGMAALLAFGATRSSLWDRDETFYAETAQEMLRTGAWLVPTFNGEPFLHKPPLIYWLMSGSIAVGGPEPLAFRIWACLAMIGVLGGLAWLAARLLGPGQGARMALLFATMPLMLVVGGAATTDAVLLLAIMVAMLPWLGALAAPTPVTTASWTRALLMGLGMGVGMLTKAPLGIAVPGASLVLGWWLVRRAHRRAPLAIPAPPPLLRDLALGLVLATGIYLAWAIPTNLATNGAFLQEAVGKHIVGRAMAPMESHGGPLWRSWPYYLVVVLVACLPWTAYLPAALSALVGGRLGDYRLRIAIIAWFVPTCVLMTLVATKLPHYIVPALPGVGLALAATIAAAERGTLGTRDLRFLAAGRWLLAGLFIPLGLCLIVAPWFLPVDDPRPLDEAYGALFKLRHAAVGLGAVFLAIPLLIWNSWLTRPAIAARMLALGMIVIALGLGAFLMPALEPFKPSPVVGAIIQRATSQDVPVATAGYDEPSLLLAIDRSPLPDLGNPELIRAWAAAAGPGVLVATREALAQAGIAAGQPGLTLLDQRRGYNYSRGRWLELVTLGRNLPPR